MTWGQLDAISHCIFLNDLGIMMRMKHFSAQKTLAATVALTGLAVASFAFAATTTTVSPTPDPSLSRSNIHHVTSGKKTGAPVLRKGFGGTVTAITGTTITVSSGGKNPQTYSIDASKARVIGGTVKAIIDIKVGDDLVAIGTITGTNISAKLIIDRPAGEKTPKAFMSHRKATQDAATK